VRSGQTEVDSRLIDSPGDAFVASALSNTFWIRNDNSVFYRAGGQSRTLLRLTTSAGGTGSITQRPTTSDS